MLNDAKGPLKLRSLVRPSSIPASTAPKKKIGAITKADFGGCVFERYAGEATDVGHCDRLCARQAYWPRPINDLSRRVIYCAEERPGLIPSGCLMLHVGLLLSK